MPNRLLETDDGLDPAKLLSSDLGLVSRAVFSSETIYQCEQKRIFERNWIYLAHESQIPKPGDFVTAYIGEIPIIVARGRDGGIVASVNSCRHRGLRVCRADQGNATRFVCPYHNWTYACTGELVGIPQMRLTKPVDKAELHLKRVPRVETIFGLIFGCLDPEIEPLERYLGEHRFYMEAFFERFPGGLEIVGPAHKWRLQANWKIPVENMLGDVGHAPYLHSALIPPQSESAKEIEDYAVTAVARPGHSAVFRLMPRDSLPEDACNIDPSMPAELKEYLIEVQRTVADRLSPLQARLKGMALGVYPNLSLLWGQSTLRISHPRAPGLIEYWSWWMAPIKAPDSIRAMLRLKYNSLFGPSGIIEQEDSYAWSQQVEGSSIAYLYDHPYHYGLGQGEEGRHDELPGTVGRCYNEHYVRSFYQRWRQDMFEGKA